jgi:hypothetical protein
MKHLIPLVRTTFCTIALTMQALFVCAQLPSTNLYLLSMSKYGDSIALSSPKFLTDFNNGGYNNQPHFSTNNELYFTALASKETGAQTDVYSLSLLTGIRTRVTATAESEYSPTAMPDRLNFSCVRVDATNSNPPVQRLWRYPMSRADGGAPVLKYETNIGYHCWLSDNKLALFILDGEAGNHLSLVTVNDESSIRLTPNIGRTLLRLPSGKLGYIEKKSEKAWFIKQLDPNTYASETIAQTLPNCEDFTVLSDGTILMGIGAKLFSFRIGSGAKQWKLIADLSVFGITNIKRMTISREEDKLVLVNDLSKE